MANNKSAQKRINVTKRNRFRNRFYLSSTRNLSKQFYNSLSLYKISKDSKNKDNIQNLLNSIYSLIDKGTKKRVFHRNTAARKKSRLAAHFKIV